MQKSKNFRTGHITPGGVGVPSPGFPFGPGRGGQGGGGHGRCQGSEQGVVPVAGTPGSQAVGIGQEQGG